MATAKTATSTEPTAPNQVLADRPEGRCGRRGFAVTERDRLVLRFIAAQRFVLGCQVQAMLGRDRTVAYRRLAGLVKVGLLSYRRIFYGEPGVFQSTNGGLAIIDSSLPRPKVDLRTYRHDVGTVWLWIQARRGAFGLAEGVLSERELRSLDQTPDRPPGEEPFGVQVDGFDRGGRPRVHHPDVLVVDRLGARVALELELSVKARRRLESILLGYASCRRLNRVIYLTDSAPVDQALGQVIRSYGLDELVEVHYVPGQQPDKQWWMWRYLNRPEVTGR